MELLGRFGARFGKPGRHPVFLGFVPGRLEVLGRHTDYAGGHSLVCAIDRGFLFMAAANDRGTVRMAGDRDEFEPIEFPAASSIVPAAGGWANYPMTMTQRLASNLGTPRQARRGRHRVLQHPAGRQRHERVLGAHDDDVPRPRRGRRPGGLAPVPRRHPRRGGPGHVPRLLRERPDLPRARRRPGGRHVRGIRGPHRDPERQGGHALPVPVRAHGPQGRPLLAGGSRLRGLLLGGPGGEDEGGAGALQPRRAPRAGGCRRLQPGVARGPAEPRGRGGSRRSPSRQAGVARGRTRARGDSAGAPAGRTRPPVHARGSPVPARGGAGALPPGHARGSAG